MTRAPDQSTDFERLLEERGALVTFMPLIRIGPPPEERALQAAVDRADSYNWLVFTSAAGVEAFARRRQTPLNADVRIAVVGPATGHAVMERLGRGVDLTPTEFSASGLAAALATQARAHDSVLIIAAHDASPVLAAKASAAGLRVDKTDAYTTLENPPGDLCDRVAASDVIALASPSAVRALVRGLGEAQAPAKLRGKLLACIGPVTLLEARERGLHVEIIPTYATLPALVDALCQYYTTQHS